MKVTPLGAVLLAAIVVGAVLAIVTSGGAQVIGFCLVALGVLLVAGEGVMGGGFGAAARRKHEVLLRDAAARGATPISGPAPVDEEAWERERARRRETRSE
jgi:hypothetical protein